MKTIKYGISLLLSLLTFIGCDDFLEEKPLDFYYYMYSNFTFTFSIFIELPL